MDTGQKIWQILPLGPTGYGDSPYQCFSAFGGNPLLLSLDRLVDHEYLTAKDVVGRQRFPLGRVDYRAVIQWKFPVLAKAAKALLRRASERYEFDCDRNAHWLGRRRLATHGSCCRGRRRRVRRRRRLERHRSGHVLDPTDDRHLYAAANRRRLACDTTSGSGGYPGAETLLLFTFS